MGRVFGVHASQRSAAHGDYVPGLYRRSDSDCLTAVNYNSRSWVYRNTVLVIDFWDRVQARWERHRCQASDWQMRRDSTGTRQRFEIDYSTALSVHAVPWNTVARLVSVSYGR